LDCDSVCVGPATCLSFLRSGDPILTLRSAAVGRFTSHESQVTNYRISTRHCVPSRFRANSFNTKDRHTRYSTLIEGSRSICSRRNKCHTMQSLFPSNSFKTKESDPNKVTHFSQARAPSVDAGQGSQCPRRVEPGRSSAGGGSLGRRRATLRHPWAARTYPGCRAPCS
jgi:hypothetical protein